jgi:flagellin
LGFAAGTFGGDGVGGRLSEVSVATSESAIKALGVLDNAIQTVSNARSDLGAKQNRLEYTVNNLTTMVTNTSASQSRILDTDYAVETTKLARAQIIQQAATAMLAQANQQPSGVLALLQ